MYRLPGAEPIDYLVVGHLTEDITPQGSQLGGTVAYAALTAQALGMRVGIVTSSNEEMPLGRLSEIPVASFPSEHTTTFENIYTPLGRIQKLHHRADNLNYYQIPEIWRQAAIVHLAPVIQEISTSTLNQFQDRFLCLTPQGWLRSWDEEGNISPSEWPESDYALRHADAVVISDEDVEGDVNRISEMAVSSRILVVTHGAKGASVYMNGAIHNIKAPLVKEIEPTGAGDIFAAAFFVKLFESNNPVDAAHFANQIASLSVTREGLDSAPTKDDIFNLMIEVS
ncbi:MAG: ribokinase [Chloroflexi bacterium]|nr:ribokinase [Chloroflexota bacterium]